jgi:glutamate-5-semialdehyde dehydrogenase
MVESTDRALVGEMLKMSTDRPGRAPRRRELIRFVAENARMPVLIGGTGVCHTYVDRAADLAKAEEIVNNARSAAGRPSATALDTVLVHSGVAEASCPPWAALGRQGGDALRPRRSDCCGPRRSGLDLERRPRTTSGRSFWPT